MRVKVRGLWVGKPQIGRCTEYDGRVTGYLFSGVAAPLRRCTRITPVGEWPWAPPHASLEGGMDLQAPQSQSYLPVRSTNCMDVDGAFLLSPPARPPSVPLRWSLSPFGGGWHVALAPAESFLLRQEETLFLVWRLAADPGTAFDAHTHTPLHLIPAGPPSCVAAAASFPLICIAGSAPLEPARG